MVSKFISDFAYEFVLARCVNWGSLEATHVSASSVRVDDLSEGVSETCEFRDDVLLVSIKYGYLVAVTQTQIYVCKEHNWSNPSFIELRDKWPQAVWQQEKYNFISISTDHILRKFFIDFGLRARFLITIKILFQRSITWFT